MITRFISFILFLFIVFDGLAQRPFGHQLAIPADSTCIIGWASHVNIQRGFQNLADTTIGKANVGDESAAIGAAKQNGVLSLGDGGSVVVSFEGNIFNGDGADFAVFENGFSFNNDSTFYLEYAFVEVSSDGLHFVRFPNQFLNDTAIQCDFVYGNNPLKSKNLAGNFAFGYGTPFDLNDLKDSSQVNINRISHIKIIDAVGSLLNEYAQRDSYGIKINDPWPTPFPSSGFDLDAVGVMHLHTGIVSIQPKAMIGFYPNPSKSGDCIQIQQTAGLKEILIKDISGKVIQQIPMNSMQPNASIVGLMAGIYFVELKSEMASQTQKIIVE